MKKTIFLVVRFLDDVVEYNISRYLNEIIKNITKDKRKIGLGVCGLADLLKKLKLDYDSEQTRSVVENLFSYINYVSKKASIKLSKERGSFGKFNESKYVTEDNIIEKYSKKPTETITENQWIELEKEIKESGVRNCATIALPPTGRSSLIIRASQSIEPYFEKMLRISSENQLLMIASIQKFVDESISKTVNVNENTTFGEIEKIIKKSITLNLKGVTIYRDKSRNYQPAKLNKT
jgi:ribonucleoside-diphosphate reductase alpha chain